MANERDILGRPRTRPPFAADSLLKDRVREAVATLTAPEADAAPTPTTTPTSRSLDLEAFLARAERADGLALERLLPRAVRRRPQAASRGTGARRTPARTSKAELKALKDAQAAYAKASNADLAWALRDRLRGFLDAYEDPQARTRRRRLRRPPPRSPRRPDRDTLPVRRYFQKRFDFILVDEFQDTDPLQAQIAFLLAEDPEGRARPTDWRDVPPRSPASSSSSATPSRASTASAAPTSRSTKR